MSSRRSLPPLQTRPAATSACTPATKRSMGSTLDARFRGASATSRAARTISASETPSAFARCRRSRSWRSSMYSCLRTLAIYIIYITSRMNAMALVAFDLDGTLEDSRPDMVAAVDRVRRELGLPPRTYDASVAWVNQGMPQLYAKCFDDFAGPAAEVQERYLRAYEEGICEATRPYPGIAAALDVLAGEATLAVVTNKPHRHSQLLLERLGLLVHFALIVGEEDTPEPKPSPKALA